ncbi:30S ribosomal protein S20 [Neochlamydia sp. S13]|uniref:30S ribosomal protein S20 n=1 Tax=Neochlamydia sp. S13 TaxID=1353976 RepID=UPI0005A985B6|nr:30S ribosomal protein S20 [Neochlamydia sp. S13]BBI18042.1 30S ribosomal protein S20 [Neochlamydia sp. S13]
MAQAPSEKKKEKRSSALKRDLQSIKRNQINRVFKSQVRTAVRALEENLSKKDAALNHKHLSEIYSLMDKGVKKGVYKVNKANRTKARFAARAAKAL